MKPQTHIISYTTKKEMLMNLPMVIWSGIAVPKKEAKPAINRKQLIQRMARNLFINISFRFIKNKITKISEGVKHVLGDFKIFYYETLFQQ